MILGKALYKVYMIIIIIIIIIIIKIRSCKGGVASLDDPCIPGYTGPVCGMCSFGYYKQIQSCKECPTKKSVAIQLGAIVAALAFIAAVVMWYSRKKVQQNEGRALIDIVFARLKIIIGFYQVFSGPLILLLFLNGGEKEERDGDGNGEGFMRPPRDGKYLLSS